MEYYSTLKRNEFSKSENTHRKQCILPSEKSQSEKTTYYIILIIWHSREGKNYGDSKKGQWLPGFRGEA